MSSQKLSEVLKKIGSKVISGFEKAEVEVEDLVKHLNKVSKDIDSAWEKAALQESRITGNLMSDELLGLKIYNVHFVEYHNGIKTTDVPVFSASSPEWAFGYCKSHLEMAVKDETKQDTDWWYFYVTEMEINTADSGETWIAAIDWNGRLATNTYHYDKGYNHPYQREHIIYEVEDCENCAEQEKEEEVKIAERTAAAIDGAQNFMKKFFNSESTTVRKDGDWFKIWAVTKSGNLEITDYEYKTLHKQFGIHAGNRILFYLMRG